MHEVLDGARRDRVQRRARLVHEHHLGLHGQRAGDAKPLRLPAGEPERRLVETILHLVPQRGLAQRVLDDLVQAGYLRAIPVDPITHSSETWVTDTSDAMYSLDETEPGIDDVHSGSNAIGSNGQPYSSW